LKGIEKTYKDKVKLFKWFWGEWGEGCQKNIFCLRFNETNSIFVDNVALSDGF
jgi:hypothetical protein